MFVVAWVLLIVSNVWTMEYQHTLESDNMNFSWSLDEDRIHIEISAKTTGWVGIGFNPEKAMKGSNIIIGAVKKGKAKIEDHFGNKTRGHIPDSKEGGQNHVENASGNEVDGFTTLSFTIPLDTGEKFDTPIKADGTDIVMLAYGGGRDNFKGRHPFRAVYKVNLKTGENKRMK